MPLTYYQRKERLPFGAAQRVAEAVPCLKSKVSSVLTGRMRDRDVETRLANLMRDPATNARVSVFEAFGPRARNLRRRAAPAGATS